MTKIILEIDDALNEVEVLAERAKLMVEDVQQGYFDQIIKGADGAWRIMPPFYDTARVKADIANSILFDLLNRLKELRALMDKAGEAGATV